MAMDLELQGKRAVVTGASKGIGLAITRTLVGEGVTVVAGSRHNTPELDALAVTGSVQTVLVDLATDSGPVDLVRTALQ
jgi:NAD(P)-dependent dehydrogenase (short-subunit alcohol dehydrogenase family)